MTSIFARKALLPDGWADDVRLDIGPDGTLEAVTADAEPAGSPRLAGVVLPGMPNLHSHAFQRAMAEEIFRGHFDLDATGDVVDPALFGESVRGGPTAEIGQGLDRERNLSLEQIACDFEGEEGEALHFRKGSREGVQVESKSSQLRERSEVR